MVSKKDYDVLYKKWCKHHEPYQKWNRLTTRMPLFLKYVDCLKGKRVLELGCNAGIYGYEISKVANSYIGVDQGDCYIKQANETKAFFDMDNATFLARPVKGFIRDIQKSGKKSDINAIFATFVLYHLSDKETDLIAEEILPNCDVVLILTRTSKRSPWKKYNSRHLEKIKNVERYLDENGFYCKSEMHPTGKFGVTLARKREDVAKGKGKGAKEAKEGMGNIEEMKNAQNRGGSKGSKARTNTMSKRRNTQGKSERQHDEGLQERPVEQRNASPEGNDGVLHQEQEGHGDSCDVLFCTPEVVQPENGEEGIQETPEAA